MATTITAPSSSFSLLLLVLLFVAAVHLPSSAHADEFQNCSADGVYPAAVTSLETSPNPAKSSNDFTVSIAGQTGATGLSPSSLVTVVYEVPAIGLYTLKTMCGDDGSPSCPGPHQVFTVDHTFRLPALVLLSRSNLLKVTMLSSDPNLGREFACTVSEFLVDFPL